MAFRSTLLFVIFVLVIRYCSIIKKMTPMKYGIQETTTKVTVKFCLLIIVSVSLIIKLEENISRPIASYFNAVMPA